MNGKVEHIWEEPIVTYLWYYPSIFWRDCGKPHGSLGQGVAINYLDSNSGFHEYDAGAGRTNAVFGDNFVLRVNAATGKSAD
jgi:hypothetical protein